MSLKEIVQRILLIIVLLALAALFGWLGYIFIRDFLSEISLFK